MIVLGCHYWHVYPGHFWRAVWKESQVLQPVVCIQWIIINHRCNVYSQEVSLASRQSESNTWSQIINCRVGCSINVIYFVYWGQKWSLSIQMNYDWFLWEIAKSRGRKLLKIAIKSFLKLQDSWSLGTYFDASNIIITILKCMRWSASNCYNNDDVWSIETCSSNSKVLLLLFFFNNCNTCAIMTNTDQNNWTTLLRRADLSSIDQRFFAQACYV